MKKGRPNVILVLTDDQGYGDLGCTGSPWMKTPNLDAFSDDSVRCTDFHVSPLCTPTRGALLTGRRPLANGAFGVYGGRSLLSRDETTLGDVFANNGYRTGLFGKWHLGDNYPYRPQDRGFQRVVAHKGGGVGQTPDFWGNNYFDDTYFANGKPTRYEGYCTDVWFGQALNFIREPSDVPFLAVISTNAPHIPHLVAEEYERPYLGNSDIPDSAFCGMIANIDENFGNLRAELESMGIEDDTILLFMTDNGTWGGALVDDDQFLRHGYNAGMRGRKFSYYDGGHRVPFFARWPGGGISGGRDMNALSCHIDLLPTLVDLCDVTDPSAAARDGRSVASLLTGAQPDFPADRTEILQIDSSFEWIPSQWNNVIMTSRWRLVRGHELYDIKADPEQRTDVASEHPEVVARLRSHHENWWSQVEPGLQHHERIPLGHEAENPVKLSSFDVMGDAAVHQSDIVKAQASSGRWAVAVERSGSYRVSLRRWPSELGIPTNECISREDAARIAPYHGTLEYCTPIHAATARLKFFDDELSMPVNPGDPETVFEVDLSTTGESTLEAWFETSDQRVQGAYYVYVERLDNNGSV